MCANVIFTSDSRLGVPQGKDIYDYLKECFREELLVIFIFGKAFYDSNMCISEAGAAWATNKNYLNAIVDIDYTDIEKPCNSSKSALKMGNFSDQSQFITLLDFFTKIIETGLGETPNSEKLNNSIKKQLTGGKYSDAILNNPPVFLPRRKFLPMPFCPKCDNQMKLELSSGNPVFKCINVKCSNTIKLIT